MSADTHSVTEKMRLSEHTTNIGMKIHPIYQRQKCRPMCLVSGGIRFMQNLYDIASDLDQVYANMLYGQ